MPAAKSIRRLEGIVVGCSDAVFLQDIAGIRKLGGELTVRVYVGHDVQLATLAPYVTDLEDGRMPQALLDLQAVVVKIRSAEILVDSVCREFGRGAYAIWIRRKVESRACRDVRKDRRA